MDEADSCREFIFLAEMCERNGPIVLAAHPADAPVPADLPVRLFSCDVYGVQQEDGGDEYLLQRDSFCIIRLSAQLPQGQQQQQQQQKQQPMLSQLGSMGQGAPQQEEHEHHISNAYAAVHHFQMCEMSGRGLIRKVCVAFVTDDSHKVTRHMTIISRQLNNVARCVCEGNFTTFKADVASILADLRQLAQPSSLDAFPDLKEALPTLVQQYELLSTRSLINPAAAVPSSGSFFAEPFIAVAAASPSIPVAAPLDRVKMLQAFGRPIESWRPLMSTLSLERQRALSVALSEAHKVCALSPDVLWMLSEESRFLNHGDISGELPHTCVSDIPLGSLSAFMKCSSPLSHSSASHSTSTERPFLEFSGNEAISAMLRHHILSERAKENALEHTQSLLNAASISSKQPISKVPSSRLPLNSSLASSGESFGLQETRQLLTESLFKNVVFALLKGENVLIRGKVDDQALIMSIVRSLSIFIPQNVLYRGTKAAGAPPAMFQEWLEYPLDICDLGSVKLVGGPKSVDVHERARAYVSKIDIDDKNITSWIPKYRTDERAGLVHSIVGKKIVTDRWTNEVLIAHVSKEIVNLGRNILQWIFLQCVPRGRNLLLTKNREQADCVSKTLGIQDESGLAVTDEVKMAKRKQPIVGPTTAGTFIDIDNPADASHIRAKSSGTFAALEFPSTVGATRIRAEAQGNLDRSLETNKLSDDDNDLVQRLASLMLRNELSSSFVFRTVNISHRQFVEEKIQRARR